MPQKTVSAARKWPAGDPATGPTNSIYFRVGGDLTAYPLTTPLDGQPRVKEARRVSQIVMIQRKDGNAGTTTYKVYKRTAPGVRTEITTVAPLSIAAGGGDNAGVTAVPAVEAERQMAAGDSLEVEMTASQSAGGGNTPEDITINVEFDDLGVSPATMGGVVEVVESAPRAEVRSAGDDGRADRTDFEGGSFISHHRVLFNRVHFRISGRTGDPTMAWGIYQLPGGIMPAPGNTIPLIASATAVGPFGAAGLYTWTPVEGTVMLDTGLLFVLHGRDSVAGSYTIRTYAATSQDLFNTNVPSDLHPMQYITTIAASGGPPASIDPRENPISGGDLDPTTANVVPLIRLSKV